MNLTKLSITLPVPLFGAAKAAADTAGIELSTFIQHVLADHLGNTGWLQEEDEPLSERLLLKWRLLNRAGEIARTICLQGDFDQHITIRVIKACSLEPDWIADYTKLFGTPKEEIGGFQRSDRNSFHRELGSFIVRRIGGTVMKNRNGDPVTRNVRNEIVGQYTLLESFDPGIAEAETPVVDAPFIRTKPTRVR